MKEPKFAMLLLGRNCRYTVDVIHYATRIVTLQESQTVFNSVLIDNVEFDFTGFSEEEILTFWKCFSA